MNSQHNKLRTILIALRNFFLSGLFTIIPVAVTLFFASFLYNLIVQFISPIYDLPLQFLHIIPGTECFFVIILIVLIGFALRLFIFNRVIHYFEHIVNKIPLVRIVYSSAKILVDFFKVSDANTIIKRKVVLIPYPQKGQYHLAFLLDDAQDSYEKIIPDNFKHYPGERYVKVFMPHSPNPTGGFFFIMPQTDIIYTEISFEEAIKTLVSCGLITPESVKKLNL